MQNLLFLPYQQLNNVIIQNMDTVLNMFSPEKRFYFNKGITLV